MDPVMFLATNCKPMVLVQKHFANATPDMVNLGGPRNANTMARSDLNDEAVVHNNGLFVNPSLKDSSLTEWMGFEELGSLSQIDPVLYGPFLGNAANWLITLQWFVSFNHF